MSSPRTKKPLQPLSINEWLTGALYGSPRNKSKYLYCLHEDESIDSIAKKLSGRQTTEDEPICYEKELDWKKLAQFNYATTDPTEINWYLSMFNGCKKTDASGNNFILSSDDPNPFLWIPISDKVFICKMGTPLKIVVKTPDIISSVFYEDETGNKIGNIEKNRIVFLVVETRNAIGKKIDIDVSDINTKIEYDGKPVEDKILHGIEITSDKMKLKLYILSKSI